MRETHKPGSNIYKPGDMWEECDRCGFDYYISQMTVESTTGLLVCQKCLDDPDREDIIRNRRGR